MVSHRFLSGVLAVALCLVTACRAPDPAHTAVPSVAVRPQPLQAASLDSWGSYTKMVALETHEDALLGYVGKVVEDPRNGDLLVADTRVTHALYRFDAAGRFRHVVGGKGQGPGEFEALHTFTVLADGRIAAFALGKRLLFAPDGRVLYEAHTGANDFYAEAVDDKIYVYSVKGTQYGKTMVTRFNDRFEPETSFHAFDKRLDKYMFLPFEALTLWEGRPVVGHIYDHAASIYDPAGGDALRYDFPNRDADLEAVWQAPASAFKNPRHVAELRRGLVRMETMHAVGPLVHLLVSRSEDRNLDSVLWDPAARAAWAIHGAPLIRAGLDAGYLSMSALVGRSDRALIGTCSDPVLFARYRDAYPAARDIKLSDSDNPVLLFFEPKHPAGPQARLQGGPR